MKQVVKESVERIEDKLQSISEGFDKAMNQVFGIELTEKKASKVKEDAKPESVEDKDDEKEEKGEKKFNFEKGSKEKDSDKDDSKEDKKEEKGKKSEKEDDDDDEKDEEKPDVKGEKGEKEEKEEKEEKVSECSKGKKKLKENLVSSGDSKGADVFKTGDGKNLPEAGLSDLSKGEGKKKPKGKAGYEDVKGPSGETYDKVYTDNKSKDNETVPGEEGNKGTPVKESFFKTQKMDRASMKQKVLLTKYTKDQEGVDSKSAGFEDKDASGETYDKSAKDNAKKSEEGPTADCPLDKDANMGFKEKPKFGDALKDKKSKFPSKKPKDRGDSGSVGEKEKGEASGTEFYKK